MNSLKISKDKKIENSFNNDIRKKEWLNLDVIAAKTLEKIIEAEDYLIQLDDYQMGQGQAYPQIEDMMLKLGSLRKEYTEFVERHSELLKVDNKKIGR